MADDLVRYVVTLTAAEAGMVAARANSSHEQPADWIARVVRRRLTIGRPLSPRQLAVLREHTAGADDRAIAIALGIPKAYAADTRRRLGLTANPRQKASA